MNNVFNNVLSFIFKNYCTIAVLSQGTSLFFSFFFFLFLFASPRTCRISQARDHSHATAVIRASTVTMPDPQPIEPPGNYSSYLWIMWYLVCNGFRPWLHLFHHKIGSLTWGYITESHVSISVNPQVVVLCNTMRIRKINLYLSYAYDQLPTF